MAKRMLVDTTHPEETRVVILDGNRVEAFDFEASTKKQLKGNIYLAKVMRVEPSLQAAFVEYGGGRHGFLAFSEIHPDYYQIPIADREALLEEEAAIHKSEGAEEPTETPAVAKPDEPTDAEPSEAEAEGESSGVESKPADETEAEAGSAETEAEAGSAETEAEAGSAETESESSGVEPRKAKGRRAAPQPAAETLEEHVETLGGDEIEDVARRSRPARNYKIQEVIKRRQILLVQVVKEERGNKGAALTTYLSLAGRYCVLMPNTARGGGISRKITNHSDRKRMRDILKTLSIADGMGVILRTAGLERTKPEIRRDFDYLLRVWDKVRELTLQSTAPALVYEEANLIMRSIRDLYHKDIEEILVDGEAGYRTAKDFMRMLMPSHAKHVQPYKDPHIPLFRRYQVEAQLDEIHSPRVELKSGGYIIISPTEALVSIDVNSGRSTKERNIEGTAVKTNQEAAEEVARQLRLRDLGGLIVIDFIDMDEGRHRRQIERTVKDAMKTDRARIRLGKISAFGLLEMSRQRLRPSLLETSSETCLHCEGTGIIRSTESTSLYVLRAIEEEGVRKRSSAVTVFVPTDIALYLLNQKRETLAEIQARFHFQIVIARDDKLIPPAYRMERTRSQDGIKEEVTAAASEKAEAGKAGTEPAKEGRRSRRRRRPKKETQTEATAEATTAAETTPEATTAVETTAGANAPAGENATAGENAEGDAQPRSKRRRRGRRGGRRRTQAKNAQEGQAQNNAPVAEASAPVAKAPAQATEAPAPVAEASAPTTEAPTPVANATNDQADAPKKKPRRRRRPSRKKEGGEASTSADTAASNPASTASPETASQTTAKTPSAPAEAPTGE
ncbi:MAG: ribonuclease E/G [Rhodospirillaceae bacterium]|nr:MAG: ribonuclease E/G [Rhodospirillaceae bacterium]